MRFVVKGLSSTWGKADVHWTWIKQGCPFKPESLISIQLLGYMLQYKHIIPTIGFLFHFTKKEV